MGTGGTPPIKPPESLGDSVGCQPVRWNDWRPIKPPETFAYAQATCRRGRRCAALDPGLLQISVKQLEEKNDQAARAISIGQLNALPRLHLRPINVVVFDGSSGGLRPGR